MTEIFTPSRVDRYSNYKTARKFIPAGFDIKEDERGFYGVKKKSLDIICPLCAACHFETTATYEPDNHAHPGMLQLKEPYMSYGWEPPPPDPSAGSGVLECRECGGLLAPEGKFKVRT